MGRFGGAKFLGGIKMERLPPAATRTNALLGIDHCPVDIYPLTQNVLKHSGGRLLYVYNELNKKKLGREKPTLTLQITRVIIRSRETCRSGYGRRKALSSVSVDAQEASPEEIAKRSTLPVFLFQTWRYAISVAAGDTLASYGQ